MHHIHCWGKSFAQVHLKSFRWRLQSSEWMLIRTQASLGVCLRSPCWFGDTPRCTQSVSLALRRVPKLIPITHIVLLYRPSEIPVTNIPDIRDPSYSEGMPECHPRVWYSPELDASKFTLHILSDTPGVFQRLQYILLMHSLIFTNLLYWL